MNVICGAIYEHEKTKELLRYLPNESIVFLWHEDLDGVTVDGLKKAKVKAIINGKQSFSGSYIHDHISALMEEGIAVFDAIYVNRKNEKRFNGNECFIYNNRLFVKKNGKTQYVTHLIPYTEKLIRNKLSRATMTYPKRFERFVNNTMTYVKDEYEWFQTKPNIPSSLKQIEGKETVIVARNKEYDKDIRVLRHYLRKKNVVVIAVDGAADGLLANGVCPHFIIGDMDSISDEALTCGAILLCHAHPNGTSPGLDRIKKRNLEGETIQFVGTSEDVAITSAYWAGAKHLYLIGCRIGMTEFLEKSRLGMGATLLCRMQAGDRLTDLKGIHRLYERQLSLPSSFFLYRCSSFMKKMLFFLKERLSIAKIKEAFRLG